MTEMIQGVDDPAAAKVFGWRREQFEQMGFSESEAYVLAAHGDVSLHDVRKMLNDGCPMHLALEIVL